LWIKDRAQWSWEFLLDEAIFAGQEAQQKERQLLEMSRRVAKSTGLQYRSDSFITTQL